MRVAPGLILALAAGAAAAQPVVGACTVEGTNLDGSACTGRAEITALSEVTCRIVWITGDTATEGLCMRDGPVVAAGYRLGEAVGLAIYRLQPDGRLVGTWTVAGEAGVGTETLFPD
jgi:hypothetical protein